MAQAAYDAANNVVLYDQDLNTTNSVSFTELTITGNTNSQNIIPTSNNVYSLGSPNFIFKDIYVGSKIYLGNVTIITETSYSNLNQNVYNAYNQANVAYVQANTALSVAQAAYNQANTGGGGGGNLDGGIPSSNYGGITAIDGGTP